MTHLNDVKEFYVMREHDIDHMKCMKENILIDFQRLVK